MAGRIRSIKPEILDDDEVMSLSDEAWRMWVSMFVLADDHGNLPASERFLASRVFQDSSRRLAASLGELRRTRRVELYAVDGKTYAHIRNWNKHQRIDNAGKKKVPLQEEGQPCETFAENLGEPPRDSASRGDTSAALLLDGMGSEGMGGECTVPPSASPKTKRGTRLPEDWDPPTGEHGHSWREVARESGLKQSDVGRALEKFRDHWKSAAGSKGVKLDWDATWRNWLRDTRPNSNGAGKFFKPSEPGFDYEAKARLEREDQKRAVEQDKQAALMRAARGLPPVEDGKPVSYKAWANNKAADGAPPELPFAEPVKPLRAVQSSEDMKAKAEAFRSQVAAELESKKREAGNGI